MTRSKKRQNTHETAYEAATSCRQQLEEKGYSFSFASADRRAVDKLPDLVGVLAGAAGLPAEYRGRILDVARKMREQCGFPAYTDPSLNQPVVGSFIGPKSK